MKADDVGHSFWDHIDALRTHLLLGGGVFLIASAIAFWVADQLIHLLMIPLHGQSLVFLTVLGPFLFKMKVAFLVGTVVSPPAWLGLLLNFASPALSARSRIATGFFVMGATALGALSVLVTIVYVVPPTLAVLLALPVEGTSTLLTADSYLQFIFLEVVVVFIIFQLPLIINALAYLGIINPRRLARLRPILYMALLIALAVATPTTDVVSLGLVYGPAILFLELGLLSARLIHTPRSDGKNLR